MTAPSLPHSEQNLDRLRSRLRSHPHASSALRKMGLNSHTIDLFGMGLKEPYVPRDGDPAVTNALCFPVSDLAGTTIRRFAYLTIPGVTCDAPNPLGWGPGEPLPYWSSAPEPAAEVIVVGSPWVLWLLAQHGLGRGNPATILCSSQAGKIPAVWRTPVFWERWRRVTLLLDRTEADYQVLEVIADQLTHPPYLLHAPGLDGVRWQDELRGPARGPELQAIIAAAPPWQRQIEATLVPGDRGDLELEEAVPVHFLWQGRKLYYAFSSEQRLEKGGGTRFRYGISVLRSDGVLLEVVELPAPLGTRPSERILALSDGARVQVSVQSGQLATWRYPAIRRYLDALGSGGSPARSLKDIADQIEGWLRSNLELGHDGDYALLTTFMVLSHCFMVFEELPALRLITTRSAGPRLPEIVAVLARNAVLAGPNPSMAIARLVSEAGGTMIIDARGSGSRRQAEELEIFLSASRSRHGGSRPLINRRGDVMMTNLFGPRVLISGTRHPDQVSSRDVTIRVISIKEAGQSRGLPDLATLRDELHAWTMANGASLLMGAQAPAANGRNSSYSSLLAVANLVGGKRYRANIEDALVIPEVEPAASIDEAVATTIDRLWPDGGWVSALQLNLELQLAGFDPFALTHEAISKAISARHPQSEAPARRRVRGAQTRIYRVPGSGSGDPLAFCAIDCASCKYSSVCRLAAV